MAVSHKSVFLIGERPLVEELGEVCHGAGFDVYYKLNHVQRGASFPGYLKKGTTNLRTASLAIELTNTNKEIKKTNLKYLAPSLKKSSIILSTSITVTASEQATWIKSPDRLVGMSALPSLMRNGLIEFAPTVYTEKSVIKQVEDFVSLLGKEMSIVQDRIGMVMPRILCMLINEACFAVMENISSASDVDTAMKLGTGYPIGPIEWADTIGVDQVIAVLEALHADLGEERYRIAPLLKQLATGARWWRT